MSKEIRNFINLIKKLNENRYQDNALDKINKLGGFEKLPDIDKLALLSDSGRYDQLKKLDMAEIYRSNGGTFGRFNIKVKVKKINEQPIKHKFSQEFQDKIGWLYPYIDYDENVNRYVTVRFEEYIPDVNMKGGGTYTERPIFLDNLFPIAINDIKSEFVDYDNRIESDRKNFLDSLGFDLSDYR